jgi:N-acyl amino acid synthase of PEP-CTERM/exosortase system
MLVRHRATGIAVGAVRLIMPCWWESSWSFPFESVCGNAGQGRPDKLVEYPRHDTAEVSRFAVSRSALQAIQPRDTGRWEGPIQSCDDPRRPSQMVALGLIALLFGVSAEYAIKRWYAMMEASLSRHLSKLGIDFQRIGPAVEHRGTRYPMVARVYDLLDVIAYKNAPFRALIDEVRESVLAQGIAATSQGHSSAHRPEATSAARLPGGPFITPPATIERQPGAGLVQKSAR